MLVAFLTIVSAGIFAAHILDALLGGAQELPETQLSSGLENQPC